MNIRLALILIMTVPLIGCWQGGRINSQSEHTAQSEDNNRDESTAEDGTPQRPQYPFGIACGWEIASNIDTMNIFYPDESAKYWVALVPILRNTRLRIDGRYPNTRYFSFNIYDPILRPSDALADFELQADGEGVNPFDVEGAEPGDSYTAYLEFTAQPKEPAPNTMYAGDFLVAGESLPNPLLTAIIYRAYVPGDGVDFDGGVGLPILTLETADGDTEIMPFADCVEPLLPTLGSAVPELGLNELLLDVDIYDDPLLLAGSTIPLADADAKTHVFRGLPEFYVTFLAELLNLPIIADQAESTVPSSGGGGFLSNTHNAYAYNIFYRHKGNVILHRGKAPSFRGQENVPFNSEQLRYWSVCQNEVPTQRYSGCFRDDQAYLDDMGYFTAIVSDEADRPINAVPDNAINWLPWGPYLDAGLLYRHMLPNPQFEQSINNVPRGTLVEDVMGEYAPRTAYCTREVVEAAGDRALDIFEACAAWTQEMYGEN